MGCADSGNAADRQTLKIGTFNRRAFQPGDRHHPVVGVILNLALFFGYHVLWPRGLAGPFDWVSAVIALAAAVALFRFKRNVIHVIATCALGGLVVKTLLS